MFYLMIGQEWHPKEHTEKFATIMEAEDAAFETAKKTKETVYIFDDKEGYIKEITAKGE